MSSFIIESNKASRGYASDEESEDEDEHGSNSVSRGRNTEIGAKMKRKSMQNDKNLKALQYLSEMPNTSKTYVSSAEQLQKKTKSFSKKN